MANKIEIQNLFFRLFSTSSVSIRLENNISLRIRFSQSPTPKLKQLVSHNECQNDNGTSSVAVAADIILRFHINTGLNLLYRGVKISYDQQHMEN